MDKDQARSAIKGAFVCAVISTFITLCAAAVGVAKSGVDFGGMHLNGLLFIDVGIMLGLTIGVFFKSLTCAVVLFGYFVLSKCLQMRTFHNPAAIVSSVVFLFFYGRGAWGTFAYHRALAAEARELAERIPPVIAPPVLEGRPSQLQMPGSPSAANPPEQIQ